MFSWSYEDSMDVDLSLQKAWDFYTNPTNWLKWEEGYDAFILEGPLKPGSQIRGKIKNSPISIVTLVTEVKPYHEYKCLTKILFFNQESSTTFQEVSPQKTRINLKLYVVGLLVPFKKKIAAKALEENRSRRLSAFAELAAQI